VLESCTNTPQKRDVFESAMDKIFLVLCFEFFASDIVSGVDFWPFRHRLLVLAQQLNGNISLKFLLETKQESESFEPLICLLAFLVQKLWPENKKLII